MSYLVPVFCILLLTMHRPPGGIRRLAEAAMIFLLGYSVLGAILGLLQCFDHWSVSLLLLAATMVWTVVSPPQIPERWVHAVHPGRWLQPHRLALLLLMAVFVGISGERFEFVDMTHDAGVYSNIAKSLVEDGGNLIQPRVPAEIAASHPELAEVVFYRLNLPGIDPVEDRPGVYLYQFLLGWPAVLALGASLFGFWGASQISILVGLLAMVWFYSAVRAWCSPWLSVALSAVVFFNPILFYFSKFPTSEYYLFCIVLFLTYLHLRGRSSPALTTLCVAAIGLTHLTFIIYLPLLVLYFVWAAVEQRRTSLLAVGWSALALSVCLWADYFGSIVYTRVIIHIIIRQSFYSIFGLRPWQFVLAASLALALLGALALGLAFRPPPRFVAGLKRLRLDHLWPRWTVPVLRLWLLLVSIQAIRTAYIMGWTDRMMPDPGAGGAWSLRVNYVARGFESLLHHNLFSLVLATSLVLLPLAYLGIFLQSRRRVEERGVTAELFIVGGWTLTLAAFMFRRPDVPQNFDDARYLLPVLVSLVTLHASRVLADMPRRWVMMALTLALFFNLLFTSFQVRTPTFQGRAALTQQLDEILPDGALIASVGPPRWTHFFATHVLHYDLDARPVYLGQTVEQGMPLLRDLVKVLEPKELFLLSQDAVHLPHAEVETAHIVGWDEQYVLWRTILYPLKSNRQRLNLVVSEIENPRVWVLSGDRELDRRELSWLTPESFRPFSDADFKWSTGHLEFELPEEINAARVKVETGGRLQAFISDARLELVVNEQIRRAAVLDQPTVTFDLGETVQVRSLELRSETFVPREIGHNQDERTIGVDISRILLEPVAAPRHSDRAPQ